MKRLFFIVAVLIPFNLPAQELPPDLCAKFVKDKSAQPRVRLEELTELNALKGLDDLKQWVQMKSTDFNLPYNEYERAEFLVKGYLLKREFLDAQKNKEHDADEYSNLCGYWAEKAF